MRLFATTALIGLGFASAQWAQCADMPNCEICAMHAQCSWCSTSGCANAREANGCDGIASSPGECPTGYVCGDDDTCTFASEAGIGDLRDTCESGCGAVPDRFRCTSTGSCEQCDDYDNDPFCTTDQSACESSCVAQDLYSCSVSDRKCVSVDSDGYSSDECETSCTEGVPEELWGKWRTVELQADFTLGSEWQFEFNETMATITSPMETSHATFYQLGDMAQLEFLDGAQAGNTMTGYWEVGPTGPETRNIIISMTSPIMISVPGMYASMAGDGVGVHALSQCLDADKCDFSAPMSSSISYPKFEPIAATGSDLSGIWRGNQISADYTTGEWDFTFYDDGNVAFKSPDSDDTYGASVSVTDDAIEFTITRSPQSSDVGQKMSGIFAMDESPYNRALYLTLSDAGGEAVTSFDDGMAANQWVLWSCKSDEPGYCVFDKAAVDE